MTGRMFKGGFEIDKTEIGLEQMFELAALFLVYCSVGAATVKTGDERHWFGYGYSRGGQRWRWSE